MKRTFFLFSIIIALFSSCTTLPPSPTAAPASVPIQTSENYGLYTDADLQIYANVIDQRIQEALKSNNTGQAQELGRKRQELIAEFNRRGLKRKTAEPTRHYRHFRHARRSVVHPTVPGLPGE